MASVVMSWSKLKIEIGKTGSNDAMATQLSSIGYVKDKSASISIEEGDTLQAVASGGIVVAEQKSEASFTLTARIIEPTFDFEAGLTGNSKTGTLGTEQLVVKTTQIQDNYSVKLTPVNVGATGIKIRKAAVSYTIGLSEDEGYYMDITFKVLQCSDGELYTKFKVQASDWADD